MDAVSRGGLVTTDACVPGASLKTTLCPIDPEGEVDVPPSTCYAVTFVQPPQGLEITRLVPLQNLKLGVKTRIKFGSRVKVKARVCL